MPNVRTILRKPEINLLKTDMEFQIGNSEQQESHGNVKWISFAENLAKAST